MSRSQRDKGAAFEREVAATFAALSGWEVRRTLGQARDGGADIHVGRLVIECKRRKRFETLYRWWDQVNAAIPGIGLPYPMLAVRADARETLCVVRLADLSGIAREIVTLCDDRAVG